MEHVTQLIIFGLLMVWVVYRRVRRSIGMQPYSPNRLIVRLVLFGIVGVLILSAAIAVPSLVPGAIVGVLCGVGLALLAIKYCVTEQRGGVWYYRTHIWIESAVLAIFLGRLVYRLIGVSRAVGAGGFPGAGAAGAGAGAAAGAGTAGGAGAHGAEAAGAAIATDPITAGVFFLIIAYYIVYYVYLLRKFRK
ncbi:MAG: hypothetical protein K0R75_3371 [Paenibacillaceae bacterium]|nr:hypothetical protein [Paenibacillaceae bacterium]